MKKIVTFILVFLASQVSAETKFSVLDLQNDLKLLGFDPGPLDGFWGPKTKIAMCNFLNTDVSTCDAIVSESELKKLKAAAAKNSFKRTPANGLIWDIQRQLQILGFYSTFRTGFDDRAFRNALKSYNKSHGELETVSGKIKLSYQNKQIIERRASSRENTLQSFATDLDINSQKEVNLREQFRKSASEKSSYSVATKLRNRKTINVFRAWNRHLSWSGYGLKWQSDEPKSKTAITLDTPNWNYHYPNQNYNKYPGVEKFFTTKEWNHDPNYGKTIALEYANAEYIPWFVDLVESRTSKLSVNGVMLDWWHNRHTDSNGYSKATIKTVRKKLAAELKKRMGDDFIIMGNVNWDKDSDTVSIINGVYLELTKNPYNTSSTRLYNANELRKIERLLYYYENNLRHPKLIALEGWRKTLSLSDADRNSKENRKMAKLLTAMSVVIPTHGYILYADNNNDSALMDHEHIIYDFYKFDIGKPVTNLQKISSGAAYKEHDKGIIAYNINSKPISFKINDTHTITIPASSGAFCRYSDDKIICLPND